MKWYFALSHQTLSEPQYAAMARVAVASAVLNTKLEPNLIFNGPDCEYTQEMRRAGVNVILHESLFTDLIYKIWPTDLGYQRIACGAMLRLDIPMIEKEDDYVLYTDADTLFFRHPQVTSFKPTLFSVAPEFELGNYVDMNSGVMVINVEAMRRHHVPLREFAFANPDTLMATVDQSLMRAYFSNQWDFLPPTLNWKPYWGPAKSIEVLHFHGPKPHHIRQLAHEPNTKFPEVLHILYNRHPQHCLEMAELYFHYLEVEWPRLIK